MTELALVPDTTPQPPALIVQLLQKLAVPFQVRQERPGLNPAQRVQAVLLEDELGALLALFPQSQLLDLSRLAELTGRKLLAAEMKEGNYDRVVADALAQVEAGAQMLDVNAGIPLARQSFAVFAVNPP